MSSSFKTTVITHCGKSRHDRMDCSFRTSIKIILSTKFTTCYKHALTSRLSKSISNMTSMIEMKFPSSKLSKKICELRSFLKETKQRDNMTSCRWAETSSYFLYHPFAQSMPHLALIHRSRLSCGHMLTHTYHNLLDGGYASKSSHRNYSSSSKHHNRRHSKEKNSNSAQPPTTNNQDSAATLSSFCDEEKHEYIIDSEEFEGAIDDLEQYFRPHTVPHAVEQHEVKDASGSHDGGWVFEWTGPHITIWSRPIKGKDVMEYKVHGHYEDIPAIAFFYTQMNLTHRKHWDKSTDSLELIDSYDDADCNETELVYWRVNFPRLMAKRDYVFARRHLVDLERNRMMLFSKAVAHPHTPVIEKYVRVTDYNSKMLVKPRGSFTENGFEYIMIYNDDTKTNMPTYALKKLVRNALPQFLEIVHKESHAVVTKYRKLKESGADLSQSTDSRVRELDQMIELARARQYYNELLTQCPIDETKGTTQQDGGDNDDGNRVSSRPSSPKPSTNGVPSGDQALIRKIHPPEYLPDWRKYIETVLSEGRWTPIPLKRVHSFAGVSHSPKRWGRD